MSPRVGAVLLLVLPLVAACSRSKDAAPEPPPTVAASAAAGPARRVASAEAGGAPARERKLVQSAELRLEVPDYAQARAELDAELGRRGGYVAQASVEHADGAVATAALELRIPAPELEPFLRQLAQLGSVLSEQLQTSDVSDDYYDASARLGTARQLEQRLLEFARIQTSNVSQLLEVERELSRVRTEIETTQGRLQGYDQRSQLSSVSLQLTSRQRLSLGQPLRLSAELGHSLAESSHALAATGRGLLVLVALLTPWLPLLAGCAYLGRRLLRAPKKA